MVVKALTLLIGMVGVVVVLLGGWVGFLVLVVIVIVVVSVSVSVSTAVMVVTGLG